MRNSRKRGKHKLCPGAQLSCSRPGMNLPHQYLEPLDVKQEASLDSQKEPNQPRLGFYVKYSALDFRTEITDSIITQAMVKVVVKLSQFMYL